VSNCRAACHSEPPCNARRFPHDFNGAVANGARRGVDHPFKRRIVVAVGDQPQIGQGILDFSPFEKAQPP
jgi:hypothetical protein